MADDKYKYEYSELSIKAVVAGKDYTRLIPAFTLNAWRGSPVALLEFEIGNVESDAKGGLYSGLVKPDDPVQLVWGLDGDANTIFDGFAGDSMDSKTVMVWARDKGRELGRAVSASNTSGESPSQIVKRIVGDAGLPPSFVTAQFDGYGPLRHWVCAGETVQQALVRLSSTLAESWGADVSDLAWWVDADGQFHWGPYSDAANGRNKLKKELALSHKTNIIELEAPKTEKGQGRVLTHGWPYFQHSAPVAITDDRLAKLSGMEFRIDGVRHLQRGFCARTELVFRKP